ncbi:hypothetical protein VNO77_02810 [Canavalia gladiata]|uniref:Uncharacterized protein n=1 Tax=Canavalia gladiata TaxID=3824 RepID=A0AAN9MTN1_CANGL
MQAGRCRGCFSIWKGHFHIHFNWHAIANGVRAWDVWLAVPAIGDLCSEMTTSCYGDEINSRRLPYKSWAVAYGQPESHEIRSAITPSPTNPTLLWGITTQSQLILLDRRKALVVVALSHESQLVPLTACMSHGAPMQANTSSCGGASTGGPPCTILSLRLRLELILLIRFRHHSEGFVLAHDRVRFSGEHHQGSPWTSGQGERAIAALNAQAQSGHPEGLIERCALPSALASSSHSKGCGSQEVNGESGLCSPQESAEIRLRGFNQDNINPNVARLAWGSTPLCAMVDHEQMESRRRSLPTLDRESSVACVLLCVVRLSNGVSIDAFTSDLAFMVGRTTNLCVVNGRRNSQDRLVLLMLWPNGNG